MTSNGNKGFSTGNIVTSSERFFDSDDSNWNYVPLMTGTGTPVINFLL